LTLPVTETVLCEREPLAEPQSGAGAQGSIVRVTLNRPDKLNAINPQLIADLNTVIDALCMDSSVACMILTGAGDKAFAAGADIAAMLPMRADEGRAFSAFGQRVFTRLETVPFAVIGAVNGFALGGGCELALACDFLYASDKAKFGQPEVTLGVIPGFGGTQRLSRRIGIARARELCFTGSVFGADEALRLGIVNAVTPHAELLTRVSHVAKTIASKGRLAVAQCKRVLRTGSDVPLDIANEIETQAFGVLFGTDDRAEGMKAFIEKRPPVFTGT